MKNKEVSIILLNWNQWNETLDCIDSIFEQIIDIDFEIILVDNWSIDWSIEKIEKKYSSKIKIIKNKFNNLFAPANNQAYEISKWEYIWVLNTDTILTSDCLSWMLDYLKNNSGYWAVTCKLLNKDMTTQYHIHRRFPTFTRLLFGLVYKRFKTKTNKPAVEYLYLDKTFDKDFDIEQAGWACILIRNDILDKIWWLFDEKKFPLFYNDVDLSYRIWKNGYKIRFLWNYSLVHLKWQSTWKLNFFWTIKYIVISSLLFFKKHDLYLDYIFTKLSFILLFIILNIWAIILFILWKITILELKERFNLLVKVLYI